MHSTVYIPLKKYAGNLEDYKRFQRRLLRRKQVQGTITLRDNVVGYKKMSIGRNRWAFQIACSLEQLPGNITHTQLLQQMHNKEETRKCAFCEHTIRPNVEGDYCSELCKKNCEEYQKFKTRSFSGAVPEGLTNTRTLGIPAPIRKEGS